MTSITPVDQIADDYFDRATIDLPEASPTQMVALADGDTYQLTSAPVRKRIGEDEVRSLAYNGSVPGPTLLVRQGASVDVEFRNQADLENTVHWHGLRLENRFDGTRATQAPVPVGGTFVYRVAFPDPGVYWYHPHIREDYGQELGLYGNILVLPDAPDYWPPAHREVALTLDDILIEDGQIAAFGRAETTFAAMGRYGNVLLVNGEPDLRLTALRGEVVRFYLTNTANARVFNVALPGLRLKLVGGDSGRYECEEFVESVILAPSERAVVDVLFAQPGRLVLEHRTPARSYTLATIDVSAEPATPPLAEPFDDLRHNTEWIAARGWIEPYLETPPDKTLALVAELDLAAPEGPVVYACPMHPNVVCDEPDRCPVCGMKLVATAVSSSYVCPMHPEVVSHAQGHCPICGMALLPAAVVAHAARHDPHAHHGDADHPLHDGAHAMQHAAHGGGDQHAHDAGHGEGQARHGAADGIEWEDDMVAVNRVTTSANTRWKLIDRATGAASHAIYWQFRVGDKIKLRLVNEMDSDHPMQHPFHVHGAGRFVVLARDGVREENLVWKDTVLVRTGQTVDLLLDVTNPGTWMAHCHIAEHHESGMMLSFRVIE